MTEADIDLESFREKMQAAIDVFTRDLSGLRTGRASTALLEPLTAEVYGSRMPLVQLGTITCPEPRVLAVQVWDQGAVKGVEKAIMESNLGLNPMTEGTVIRVRLPELTTERRKELVKVAGKYAEGARITIRSVRREGMDMLKKKEKDKHISEDDSRRYSSVLQKMTDTFIQDIDETLATKEKDILKI